MKKPKSDLLAKGRSALLAMPCSVELASFEAAADDAGKPRQPTFEIAAYNGGALRVAGFYRPVVIDLNGLHTRARPAALLDHDPAQIVGQCTEVTITPNAVRVKGIITGRNDPAPKKVLDHAGDGFAWSASVGVRVDQLEAISEHTTVRVNGRDFKGPLLVARSGLLNEISFVSIGADEDAAATIAAGEENMTFEQWLKANGFEAPADAQKKVLQAAYEAEVLSASGGTNPPAPANPGGSNPPVQGGGAAGTADLDVLLARQREREERVKSLTAIAARFMKERPGQLDVIEATTRAAIAGEWDPNRLELELHRTTRPNVQGVIGASGGSRNDLTNEVLEAAICLNGKLDRVENHFSEQTLEAAQRRFRHGLGLGELLLIFAHQNGFAGHSTRDVRPLLQAAFAEHSHRTLQAAGFSTLSLPGILSNVANKFLRQGFDAIDQAWRRIAAVRSVSDFKEISSYTLTGGFVYKEVPPGGELKHAEVGEAEYKNRVNTYGTMFAIDRRQIINDDLDALAGIPRRLGRGAALKFNQVFWAKFMNNASFFSTGNKNFKDGVATALSIASLATAEEAFMEQIDPDGNPMALEPKILLVPPALKILATRLTASVELRELQDSTSTGAAAKAYGVANPFSGRFEPVATPYLGNTNFTGASAKKWYLLADPNDTPTIEAAFLNGQETPTVETADADFNVLGVQMRGYHDFGVELQEPRGGIAMKGEN